MIVAPDTRVLAGPLPGDREEIIYADLDLEIGVRMKLRHDLAGHYNRPDVFRLLVNRNASRLIETFPILELGPASGEVEVLESPTPLHHLGAGGDGAAPEENGAPPG